MKFAQVFFSPSREGLVEAKDGRNYILPVQAPDNEMIGLLVHLGPQEDGTWGHVAALEASIGLLNTLGCDSEMKLYDNLLTIHTLIRDVQPNAMVFPVTNGDRWISIDAAIAAIERVVICRTSGCRCC